MSVPWPIKFNTFRRCHVTIHVVGHPEEPDSWLIGLLLKLTYEKGNKIRTCAYANVTFVLLDCLCG